MTDIVLVLGRPDEPMDAIQQNSILLAEELTKQGRPASALTADWSGRGLVRFSRMLRREFSIQQPTWVVIHYTALGWGPRAFPVFALSAARRARRCGARLVLDFQEGDAKDGPRRYDHIRAAVQRRVMHRLAKRSARILVHLPAQIEASWPASAARPVFVPSGSNIRLSPPAPPEARSSASFSILVFCLSDTEDLNEGPELAAIMKKAAPDLPKGTVLRVLGRGADRSRNVLNSELEGTGIALDIRGVLPEATIGEAHRDADVFLFVRNGITTYRSTAATAIANGLPIVAYSSEETSEPVTDAGVICVPYRDTQAAAQALVQVAGNEALRKELSEKSRIAYEKYFSWERIAETVSTVLSDSPS